MTIKGREVCNVVGWDLCIKTQGSVVVVLQRKLCHKMHYIDVVRAFEVPIFETATRTLFWNRSYEGIGFLVVTIYCECSIRSMTCEPADDERGCSQFNELGNIVQLVNSHSSPDANQRCNFRSQNDAHIFKDRHLLTDFVWRTSDAL